jgi:ABC-type lipoprotein export system ATPase subunit
MNDQRGSCWRRWDLHVHSPYSGLNNGFGSDIKTYAKQLIERARASNIACIGITDYFLIDGYREIRSLLADRALSINILGDENHEYASSLLFLPNIELRSSIIVSRRDASGRSRDSRVNYHILFSDSVSSEDIEEDFLREIKFSAIGSPGMPDEEWPLTRRNLEQLGRRLKQQHQPFQDKSDIFVGMMNAVVNHNQAIKALESKPSKFHGKYLLALACDEDLSSVSWNDQGHQTRKLFYQSSHFLFSSNTNTRRFALGQFHDSIENYLDEFQSRKPCFHGCDAHKPEELFESTEDNLNWVKADPTFEGLLKVLIEPEDRVFIGDKPEQLKALEERSSKFINHISIKKKHGSSLLEKWFDCDIPLNPGLVAIIGNKGSGKSALGETIGLLGKSANASSFSFLNVKRFRQPKNNKAAHFEANIRWHNGTENTASLHEDPGTNAFELVKYIPQNFLESLCNGVSEDEERKFDKELRAVIFSHVREEDRLGQSSLDDLLEQQTAQSSAKIEILKSELSKITIRIANLESRGSNEFRTKLEGALAAKEDELQAHTNSKPAEVPAPQANEGQKHELAELTNRLLSKKAELAQFDICLHSLQHELAFSARKFAAAEQLIAKLDNFERICNTFKSDIASDLSLLGLSEDEVVKIQISKELLFSKRSELEASKSRLMRELDAEEERSTASKRQIVIHELKDIQGQLDAPHKAYEAYLEEANAWEKVRQQLMGSSERPDSILFCQEEISKLDNIPSLIDAQRLLAIGKSKEIFEEKSKLASIYRSLYAPVQNFIDSNAVAKHELRLQFNVDIAESGFEEAFFSYVSQGVRGSYCGTDEGRKRLRRLIAATDYATDAGVEVFLEALAKSLLIDERDNTTETRISDMIKKGQTPKALYDYIYGLDYLQPRFSLGIAGKALNELSPGERGALLLVFYLLVDQNTAPLIIDQPEENLDNQTVYRLLVPCIKDAKRRRQIILITHNPNLAVVCDADQVICSSLDKNDENRLSYNAGAIENPAINRAIVDILEGTRPAFVNREAKYLEINRQFN